MSYVYNEILKEKAISHTNEMEQFYHDDIINSINGTKEYRYDIKVDHLNRYLDTKVMLMRADTVSALFSSECYYEDNVCILNFASYKNPGGKFIDGSSAQEESLCHASTLYNVLKEFTMYYHRNKNELNRGYYSNALLYSPDIVFFDQHGYLPNKKADVITCAATNINAVNKNPNLRADTNTPYIIMKSRIDFILTAACRNNVETIILGAFGCGVFGNDTYTVARIFRQFFKKVTGKFSFAFKKVIFAVPDDKNYNIFLNPLDVQDDIIK